MKKIVIEPGQSFAQLAYLYLGASSKFRDLLEVNPQYHELDQPKPGDVIVIPDNSADTLDRSLDSLVSGSTEVEDNIYPWVNLTNYVDRLSTYHPMALINIEDCNGDSLSPATPPYVPEVEDTTANTETIVNFNLI